MNKGHYVYRYIYNDEIIYIGRTIDMDRRIYSHKYEIKFKNFCKDNNIDYCDLLIEYLVLQNSTEENVVEKMLINKNKPILNTADNHESISTFIDFSINTDWIKYENNSIKTTPIKKKNYPRLYDSDNKYQSLMDDWHMLFFSATWLLSYSKPNSNKCEIRNIPEIKGKPYLSYFYIEYGNENNFIGISFVRKTEIKKDGQKYTKLDRPICEIIKLTPLFALSMNQIRNKIINYTQLPCNFLPYFNIDISDEQIHNLIELL